MKSKLRRPFRAPREAVDRSKGEEVADQSDAAREEPPHDVVQTESEEATELGVVWKPFVVTETEYPEVESVGKDQGYVRLDSITETGDEYEARMDREQLADTENGCKMTMKMVTALGDEHAYLVRGALRDDGGIDIGKGVAMVAASPNLSEFESFLDGLTTAQNKKTKQKKAQNQKKGNTKAKNKDDSDESEDLENFGDIYLRARASSKSVGSGTSTIGKLALLPPEADNHSRTVSVDDILPEVRPNDVDVAIVNTLTFPKLKRKGRIKAQVKWTYETVLEPTGVGSKYWDAEAPSERATKRIAKEKLVALKDAESETNPKGMSIIWTLCLNLVAIEMYHNC
jgi:hypothetical protein